MSSLDGALSTTVGGSAVDFAALRAREFPRLDALGMAYLDYAASALPGVSQLRAHHTFLAEGVFGNPHSQSAPSRASGEVIERARRLVLDFFDVDASTHVVCFTANTSAAIKLVAESYPFGASAGLVLAADNHNSMNGVREYACRAGAPVRVLPLGRELRLRDAEQGLADQAAHGGGLFALPAQSNFSGVRHPLALVTRARALGFQVLLDVAAYAPSHPLSLRACPADFAVLSFYKLFGYPTGLGALVARRDSLALLRRPWFAGGTVEYVSVAANIHRLHAGHEGFEDGTPDSRRDPPHRLPGIERRRFLAHPAGCLCRRRGRRGARLARARLERRGRRACRGGGRIVRGVIHGLPMPRHPAGQSRRPDRVHRSPAPPARRTCGRPPTLSELDQPVGPDLVVGRQARRPLDELAGVRPTVQGDAGRVDGAVELVRILADVEECDPAHHRELVSARTAAVAEIEGDGEPLDEDPDRGDRLIAHHRVAHGQAVRVVAPVGVDADATARDEGVRDRHAAASTSPSPDPRTTVDPCLTSSKPSAVITES